MIRIVSAPAHEVVRESGLAVDLPVYAKLVFADDIPLAVYGLAWGAGKCWLFFHVENYRPGYGFVIRREGRKILRHAVQLGETEVFSPRDADYPTSTKLLKMLGFEFHAIEPTKVGGVDGTIEVWRWPNLQS